MSQAEMSERAARYAAESREWIRSHAAPDHSPRAARWAEAYSAAVAAGMAAPMVGAVRYCGACGRFHRSGHSGAARKAN